MASPIKSARMSLVKHLRSPMKFMRKHQGKLILVLAVILMVSWSITGVLLRMFEPQDSRGTVFGKNVSSADFDTARRSLGIVNGGTSPSDNDIWTYIALQREADRLNIKVSENETTQMLRQWVSMLTRATDENLDAAYASLLQQLGVSENTVRSALAAQMRLIKLSNLVSGAYQPSDTEAWQKFVATSLQVKLKTLLIPAKDFQSDVAKPSDAQLQFFFNQHTDNYLEPPAATVEFVSALKADLPSLVSVSDEEIDLYYEENKVEEFLRPPDEQVPDSTDETTDAEPAAEPATEPTAEPTPAATTEVADGATASDTETLYMPLSEVSAQILEKLQVRKANALFTDIEMEFFQQEVKDLKVLADRYGLPYSMVGPFAENNSASLGSLASARTSAENTVARGVELLLENAAETKSDETFELQYAEAEDGLYLFRVVSITPERLPLPAEIAVRLDEDYIKTETEKLALEKASQIAADLPVSGWDAYADAGLYTIEETELTNQLPYPGLLEAALSVEKNSFAGPVTVPRGAVVFQVLDRVEPPVEQFEQQKMFIKMLYFGTEKQAFFDQWQADLLERANITTKTSAFDENVPEPFGAEESLPY